jgi:hypothetical protein
MDELPPPLRELLDEAFTFESMYDIPPKIFSSLAAHRTCIAEAGRIPDRLHEAVPWLEGQSLVLVRNAISFDARGSLLPPPKPLVGEPGTFDVLGGMVQKVLGPASGEWVVVVDDENDTFVGARSAADIVRLEWIFGSARDGAQNILYNWEAIKTFNPTWLREWLPAVLDHVLGPDVTAELLADEGRWLAEL